MVIGTTATIAATSRILASVANDLYKAAKGNATNSFRRWQQTSFPKRLARYIESIGQVKTLWSPETEVSLTKFYHPPHIMSSDRHARKQIESVRDIAEGNIVIQGIVGQGKSILLRYLAIKEATNPNGSRIPIFLELRMLQPSFTLIHAMKKALEGYDIDVNDEAFSYVASSGKFLLILDAFDELDEALVKTTLNDLSHLSQKYPELQIIITSRPGNEIQKVSGFRIVRIAPLTRADYKPFLMKLGLPPTKISAIQEAIRNSPSKLTDLITTPLMLTLVVMVYESEKEIPPTLPEFFERLFQIVFTRHDRLKAGFNRKRFSGLSERRLQTLFEAFCFMVLQNNFGRSLSAEQFSTAFTQALEYSDNCDCDEDKFRLDVVKVACLMLDEGIDTTTFLHKSVLEYYASAFIKHSTDEVALLFYQAANNAPRAWSEVIRFLADIDPYRYSKDFALSEFKVVRAEFLEPLEERSDASLLRVIHTLHPSFAVTYLLHAEDDDTYDLEIFGPFGPAPRLIYESLADLLIQAAQQTLPKILTLSELDGMSGRHGNDTELPDEEFEIPLNKIIAFGGTAAFWNAIDIFAARVQQAENEAQLIIANQEKRKLIFASRQRKLQVPG